MKKKTFNMNVLWSFKNMFKWGGLLDIKWNNLLGTPTIFGPYNKILPTINATNLDPQGHLNHKPLLWGVKACSNDSKVAFESS